MLRDLLHAIRDVFRAIREAFRAEFGGRRTRGPQGAPVRVGGPDRGPVRRGRGRSRPPRCEACGLFVAAL